MTTHAQAKRNWATLTQRYTGVSKPSMGPRTVTPNVPYFLEMPELFSYLVNHISVLPAMLTPTTTESPSMCCLILYSYCPCSGPTHLCCNEDRITKDLVHWWTLRTRPSSAGDGGAATLHSPQRVRVRVEVVPVRQGEPCPFCMQCINSINSYYTSAHVVRFGGSACPPNKGSYLRDCLTALHSGVGVGVGVV